LILSNQCTTRTSDDAFFPILSLECAPLYQSKRERERQRDGGKEREGERERERERERDKVRFHYHILATNLRTNSLAKLPGI
jgi:hypothetical protein